MFTHWKMSPTEAAMFLTGILFLLANGCKSPASSPPPDFPRETSVSAPADWSSTVGARIAAEARAFYPVESGRFRSERGGLVADLDEDGLHASFEGVQGLDLRVGAWGREGAMSGAGTGVPRLGDCAGTGEMNPQGGCIRRIERPLQGITEWWVAHPEGAEQGFTLVDKPRGNRLIGIRLDIGGASVEFADGIATLHDAAGRRWNYGDARAWDARGEPVPVSMGAEGGSVVVWVDDRDAEWPIEVDPLLSMPAATLTDTGSSSLGAFGDSVAIAGDVDNDGFEDVLVGAPGYRSTSGRIYLYRGSASGIATTPASTIDATTTGEALGTAVAAAGDVDGDGYDDVIVGAPNWSTWTGRAYVYRGSASGLGPTPLSTFTGEATGNQFGQAVAGVGDTNRDGYAEVLVGARNYATSTGRAYLYQGSASGPTATASTVLTGPATSSNFGISVHSAGDVNRDGYADVVIGASGYQSGCGWAGVYLGGSGGLATTPTVLYWGQSGFYFGGSVAGAGDVNNDGYDDVVVGVSNYTLGATTNMGAVFLYFGGAAGVDATRDQVLGGPAAYRYFGRALDGAGDVNGDSYDDLVVSDRGPGNGNGQAGVYLGSSSGYSTTATATWTGQADNENLGESVGGGGDIDGDGRPEVVMGATAYQSLGRTVVSSQGIQGTSTSLLGEPNTADFGYSVSGAGDVDADGYDDVLVGVPGYWGSTGRTYLFPGGPGGPSATAATTITGTQLQEGLGTSIDGAGDVNGDGFADVIIGSYHYQDQMGKAGVYLGSGAGLAASPTIIWTGPHTTSNFGGTVAGAGDINGDSYDDVMVGAVYANPRGAVYLYHGSASGPATNASSTLPAPSTLTYFGGVLTRLGDVNRDGYDDVAFAVPQLNLGTVLVFPGSASGVLPVAVNTFVGTIGTIGQSVSGVGDVNADGYADIAISNTAPTGNGSLLVYHGSGQYFGTAPASMIVGPTVTNYTYVGGARAGDANADGYDDVLFTSSAWTTNTGQVLLYEGASAGLRTTAAVTTLSGYATDSYFGFAVDEAGDVNGDGFSDVVIGARDEADIGVVRVFLGYADADGDGYRTGGDGTNPDCDDSDPNVHPGAQELCDAADEDEDCDGVADDADPSVSSSGMASWYLDADGDGHGAGSSTTLACDRPAGCSATASDCNDANASVQPGGQEVCDTANADEDCDGAADDADPSVSASTWSTWYRDVDGDGFGGSASTSTACDPPTGHTASSTDCDDANVGVHPGAQELCDDANVDEDCDGVADDADPGGATGQASWYADSDGDSYGAGATTVVACDPGAGHSASSTDCDDANPAVNPGAFEVCDTANADEDCDGTADDADPSANGRSAWYRDADSDGYGLSSLIVWACESPGGYAAVGTDCNDSNPTENPSATEICDPANTDEDCDGVADDADQSVSGASTTPWYHDADGDDYGTITSVTSACDPPVGYVADSTDCNDGSPLIQPGAAEVCDAVDLDEDCDGLSDDADPGVSTATRSIWYWDADADGYGSPASTRTACDRSTGWSASSTDCDDANPMVSPASTETCDAADTDEDCDGLPDDADPSVSTASMASWHADMDGDGYGTTPVIATSCDPAADQVADGTDCDDADPATHPGAAETCGDAIDRNCDGSADDTDADQDGHPACEDCDDGRPDVHPGAMEVCDANDVDEDCNGLADDEDPDVEPLGLTTWYTDGDGDGWGDPLASSLACDAPEGMIADGTDCNDLDAAFHPGAKEPDCTDPNDYNCDGSVAWADGDSDGHAACEDCDDARDDVNPSEDEVCDPDDIDEDCDGLVDDDDPSVTGQATGYLDADGDGFGRADMSMVSCDLPNGYVEDATDCDDLLAAVYPGASEVAGDGIDQDCDGADLPGDSGETGAPDSGGPDGPPADSGKLTDTGEGKQESCAGCSSGGSRLSVASIYGILVMALIRRKDGHSPDGRVVAPRNRSNMDSRGPESGHGSEWGWFTNGRWKTSQNEQQASATEAGSPRPENHIGTEMAPTMMAHWKISRSRWRSVTRTKIKPEKAR